MPVTPSSRAVAADCPPARNASRRIAGLRVYPYLLLASRGEQLSPDCRKQPRTTPAAVCIDEQGRLVLEAAETSAEAAERRDGRVAEGGGLLNRYTVDKPYRGFESLSLRQKACKKASIFAVNSEVALFRAYSPAYTFKPVRGANGACVRQGGALTAPPSSGPRGP